MKKQQGKLSSHAFNATQSGFVTERILRRRDSVVAEAKSPQQQSTHAWVSPARERPPVSPFAAQQCQGHPCDAVCSITLKASGSGDMRQCDSLPQERSLSFVYAC